MHKCWLFLVALLYLSSCAPSRFVKPLNEGETRASLDLGGPLITFSGAPMPVPLSSVTVGHGLKNNTTVFGSLHTTAAIFGVVQGEVGLNTLILNSDSLGTSAPSISVNPVLNFAGDIWENNMKIWPQADLNFFWEFGEKNHAFYVGASNWIEFKDRRAHNEVQKTHLLVNPHLGLKTRGPKMRFSTELKYLAPGVNNKSVVVDYLNPLGDKGGIGIYFGISFPLNRLTKNTDHAN